ELLISGKTPRPAPPPPRAAAETVYTVPVVSVERRSAPRGGGSYKSALVVLLFLAVFAFTTKVLLDRRKPAQPQVEAEAVPVEVATRPDANTRTEATHKPNRAESTVEEQPAVASDTTTSTAPTPALATVTVLIDPESGLLAKPDCPVRSRMTYPSGSQPSAHCNINHAPPPKNSKPSKKKSCTKTRIRFVPASDTSSARSRRAGRRSLETVRYVATSSE